MRLPAAAALGSQVLLPTAAIVGGSTGLALAGAWAVAQAAITIEILRPRSQCFGETIWRGAASKPQVALTFDDGPSEAATPALLRALEACDTRATFFLVARRALEHPGLVRDIIGRGHEVGVHSLTHPWWFSLAGPSRIRREVVEAARILEELAGERPAFFRPPMGHKSAFLEGPLQDAGLRMVTWTARAFDTVRRDPEALRRSLLEGAGPGAILLLHEGRGADGAAPMLGVLPDLVRELRGRGLEPVTLRELLAAAPRPSPPAGTSAGRPS